jgi:preprotein translocase subunit SecY
MISAFANIWRVPELRDRILFTLVMIVIVRLGVAITLPGVDATVIDTWLDWRVKNDEGGSAIGVLLNVFSGGALQQCGIFALGIMPYISSSIMMQLMTAVVPKLAKLSREEGGRQKINQYTRFITIIIAVVQGFLLAQTLQNPASIPYMEGIDVHGGGPLVPDQGMSFVLITVLTILAGTMLLMWIGDQITERGIGNGISLIISVNIIAALPGALVQAFNTYVSAEAAAENPFKPMILVGLVALLLVVIAAVIAITQAQRRIAIQYAKRVRGKQLTGQQTQYLPLKVNYSGVMPIIFASAILSLPTMLLRSAFAGKAWAASLGDILNPPSIWFYFISAGMIFFFSYFWVATMFQPSEIAENLKRSGGYVPGVRPGKPTADFLDFTMTRLTFAGALFLTAVYIMPSLLTITLKLNFVVTSFFGGTSLLILVGVLLDILRQTETHLLQRHYDGFLRKGKIRGRGRVQGAGAAATSSTLVYLWAFAAVLVLIAIVAWIMNRA